MDRDLWTMEREQGYSALRELNFDQAEQHFRLALAEVCHFGALNPRVAAGHMDLAELFRARGLVTDAEKELKRAVTLVERRLGPSSDEALKVNARLAEFYARLQRWDKARPVLIRMMALQYGCRSDSAVAAADLLRRYAESLAAQERLADAALFCGFALELHAQELGEEHMETARDHALLRQWLAVDEEEVFASSAEPAEALVA